LAIVLWDSCLRDLSDDLPPLARLGREAARPWDVALVLKALRLDRCSFGASTARMLLYGSVFHMTDNVRVTGFEDL
jgi:hypothetical protein